MKKSTFYVLALLFSLLVSSCGASKQTVSRPEEALNWKLGAQSYTFRLFTLAEALDKIDSCGLRYVEAFPGQTVGAGNSEKFNYTLSSEGKALVKKLVKEKGMTLYAFGVTGGKDAAEWEQIFAFAKEMGIQVITCEPREEHLDIVSALCEKYNVRAAIHNHPNPSHYWDPEVVLDALKGRSAKMGAAVDVGHWMRSGLDPVACLKKLEGHIIHSHFKDLNGFGDKKAHDVHWGTGKLPIREVVAELKRQKFSGMLSAEYEYNWENNKDDVRTSVANFRELLKE
ncbi:sugar phosphate isomerase/epimerase family protein [Sphingobacterium suaedae]|uniref:Sugar phosphate isomerase/epimerase family protein n=1 Tax=Sphingobacterium suaedae TaxID=1686402 RepID=A0ABW5KNB7_9SPHI